ncbi:MAG TPA: alpha/beta fold hydrolase [Mycobacteriales bacterium]|jgi:acetyl esterase/lipase|nr:alpha/beta fold hydrolase [Mycobacteriales bacterium]
MRPSTFRRCTVAAIVAAVAAGSLSPALATPGKRRGPKPKPAKSHAVTDYAPRCVGDPADVQRLDLTVDGQPTWGLYAMPAVPAKGIVVFAHGYGHTAESWRKHIADTARRDGVVAVAMDYRGQVDDFSTTPLPSSRGWQVREGAADSIAAAKLFNRLCPGARTIVMYGVSMGGNTAGLAVAAGAKRASGQPLFDYWFDIEGATTVAETYLEARALSLSGNAFAKNAVADIERENGGRTIEQDPAAYQDLSVVTHGDDIKASGVKGVVMVQGVDDGLVGYNQSPELYTRLRSLGIPVDFWTALTRGDASEPGTTLDGYVTGNIPGFTSPFAGHASEASDTHIVGNAGFERLAALFRGVAPACRTGLLDGTAGFTETNPATSPATC